MELLAFPCNRELVGFFLARLDRVPRAALILQKQEQPLRELLASYGITELFIIPETYYGHVTTARTRSVLAEVRGRGFSRALFPISDFCGNAALLLSTLVPAVAAVSATAPQPVIQELTPLAKLPPLGCTFERSMLLKLQRRIVERLAAAAIELDGMADGDRAGEKPAGGLIANFPYDCGVLFRYAFAASKLHGKVLEVGCGIGYGAYLMAELNPTLQVRAVDIDPEAIALAERLWGDHERLSFALAAAETLPCETGTIDGVAAFEVIEHLKTPKTLLDESHRILKPGGVLVGSTPNSLLFPYRVNDRWEVSPGRLRSEGVWPWHLQHFDEASLLALTNRCGFSGLDIHYPTFVKGVELYARLSRASFDQALDLLKELIWSAADFAALTEHVPCFSDYSFLFSGFRDRT